ncbi:hypothetical protein Gpo141_00001972 [Globisporangium polare]
MVVVANAGGATKPDEANLRKNGQTAPTLVLRISDTPKKKKLTGGQIIHLIRRVLVIFATIQYISTSIHACLDSMTLLQSFGDPSGDFQLYESKLMGKYAGKTTMRESPLLLGALGNDTSPRSGTLYLEAGITSFTDCPTLSVTSPIYQDKFQRSMFASIAASTAYNLTFLDAATSELIMPVVDCTLTSLVTGDTSSPKYFYLMRMLDDPEDVYLLVVSQSVQEYSVTKQKTSGTLAVATIAFINDLRAKQVTHHFVAALGYPYKQPVFEVYEFREQTAQNTWVLKSIPPNPLVEASKLVETTCPSGFYVSSLNEQANFVNAMWNLSQDPLEVISKWNWDAKSVLRDSWAWVHFLHLYFAVNAIFRLLTLFVLIYSNFVNGKIWVGDGFVAISSNLSVRSVLVTISWIMDGFYALTEFALYNGNELGGVRQGYVYASVMEADLLAHYLSIVAIIGNLSSERIDPTVSMLLFYLGFHQRLAITKLFPSMVKVLVDFADNEYMLGLAVQDPSVPKISPLQVWTIHQMPKPGKGVLFATIFPVASTLVFVVVYVLVRKAFRRFRPDLTKKWKMNSTKNLQSDSSGQSLTQFELASGMELQARYGVVTDYDNYVYIKGMKFASADGIYTSGFVIINGMFLVDSDDLFTIFFMKLVRVRFKNVYVYEVDGNTVKETARLVYPEMFKFRDMYRINLKILL